MSGPLGVPVLPRLLVAWAIRVRAYVTIIGGRNLAMGIAAFVYADRFDADLYDPMRSILPIYVWATAFVVTGATLIVGVLTRHVAPLRVGLVASSVLLAVLSYAFIVAAFLGNTGTLWGPVVFLALLGKDLAVAASPMLGFDGGRRGR